MAKNKYYAVKVGKTLGIFDSWKECEESVKGVSGAVFSGFKTYEEAEMYFNEIDGIDIDTNLELLNEEGSINVFTDGSYDKTLNFCSYGYVMFENECNLITDSAAMYDKHGSMNISGEIAGVKAAIDRAIYYKKKKVKVFHDLIGISKWVSGEYKAKTPVSISYVEFIENKKNEIEILFQHVKGHSGNLYNDIADALAKNELKSLKPDIESDWGFKSYKFDENKLFRVLDKIKDNYDGFYYTKVDKVSHFVTKCYLKKESVTITKYKFNKGNKLLIPKTKDLSLFTLIVSFLNDVGKIESVIQTLNANNRTSFEHEEVKTKLYDICPLFKSNIIQPNIFRLLITATYEFMREIDFVEDASYIILPAMRALEGHLKYLIKTYLGLSIKKGNFICFEPDNSGGRKIQDAHRAKTTNKFASYIEKCYNIYYNVRHVYLHFGDYDLQDTKFMNSNDSKEKIENTLKLIEEYFSI